MNNAKQDDYSKNLLHMLQRIDALESRQAFQDLTIEELNRAIVQYQSEIEKLRIQLRFLSEKLLASQPSDIATQNEETPPPHY